MAISVMTNIASLVAQQSLNGATTKLNKSVENLATGFKVNSSKDNPAISAVSSKFEFNVNSFSIVSNNIQMGASFLNTQEGILNTFNDSIIRIRELTEEAANGVYSSDSLHGIKEEVQERLEEITRLSKTTEFNGKFMLDGSIKEDINLQVGIKNKSESVITLDKSLFESAAASVILNTGTSTIEDFFKDEETARAFLKNIDDGLSMISEKIATIGSVQQRLTAALNAVDVINDNSIKTISFIKDTDVAEESTNYVKQQIIQQMSTSVLSTANQTPSMALNLL